MAEKINHVVTFGRYEDATDAIDIEELQMVRIPFKIEPPINIYASDVIQKGLERIQPRGSIGHICHPVDNARVTHATDEATFGTIDAYESVIWAEMNVFPIADDAPDFTHDWEPEPVSEEDRANSLAERAEFEKIAAEAFNSAFSAFGGVELEFVFDSSVDSVS